MTKSMTAFARAEADAMAWEIRSVNQRYLDVSFKMPEAFRNLETELRNLLRDKIQRGKVDCLLRLDIENLAATEYEIDEAELRKLRSASDQVSAIFGNADAPTTLDILRWPGVIIESTSDVDENNKRIKATFHEAVTNMVSMREREGDELARIIGEKLASLETIVSQVKLEAATINERQEQKLRTRLAALNIEADPGRLEQELVFLAQKSDIAEEIDRLETHIEEVKSTLAQTKPVGRRLDFLMQELNREANTLSSKATAANTSIQAVELKVIIEQMREQVQNIE